MKKIMQSIIGVSLSLGLSSMLYATGNADTTCYAVSDDVAEIYIIKPNKTNILTATVIDTSAIGADTQGIYNGEGSAFNAKTKELYLFNNSSLGTTDDQGKFDLYAVDISDISKPKERLIKKNFTTFEVVASEYYNNKLYIIKEDDTSTLYVYNTKTWKVESQVTIKHKISALAINTKTGEAYVMDDRDKNPTEAAELFKLNLSSGKLTSVGTLTNDAFDAESLSFGANGKLYTENERGESKRSIYEISTKNASVNLVAYLPGENNISKNDIESISCISTNVGITKPTTDNKVNPKMLNSLGAVNILNLSGKDSHGVAIERFTIISLPSANQGILYMEDASTPVEVNQTLTLVEANGLKFDPNENFEGDVTFVYVSVDKDGLVGNEATVTIPLVSSHGQVIPPVTDDKVNPSMLNTLSAVNILNLSGKDSNGVAVKNFIITSLPKANQGVLYMADGTTAVTLNQELTVQEANGLRFDPKSSFVGNVIFHYVALDDNGVRGNEGKVTIPVKAEGEDNTLPSTDNKKNNTIFNTVGAVDIINLSGSDSEGNIVQRFVISSLPSVEQGILYMADGTTAVTLNQELTLEEANGLKFDPKEDFVGDAIFNYIAVDANGIKGNEATVTIPVVSEGGENNIPKTDNKKNNTIFNTVGAVDIINLSGSDSEGNAVQRFVISSLPSVEQGILYMADGITPVTLNQELTLEEANGLKFDPKEGFVGDAIFNYMAVDANGVKGNEATVTIPVIAENNNQVPTTDNKRNPELLNSMGAVNITNLSGTDAEGNAVERFVITSLPSANEGVLFMADGTTPVTLNQELTLEEANGLKFDPTEEFVGDAIFNYASIDKNGLRGEEATVTIPVVTEHGEGIIKPITDDRLNPNILNSMGAVNITDLSGTDAEGNAVERFVITSLPSASEGVLFMADGTTPVTLNQELTLEEANGLKFDPKEDFVGDAIFNYVAVDNNGVRGEEGSVTLPIVDSLTECVCEDYTESVPLFGGMISLFMLFISSFFGLMFLRKED